MDVKDALVTLGEDGLVADKLKDVDLSLEQFCDWYGGLVSQAENITLVHLIFTIKRNAQLDVFTGLSVLNAQLFAVVDSNDSACEAGWHQLEEVSKLVCA